MMIGQPINRVDGPLKVAGRATYAYEHWDELREAGQPLYGFIAGATIGKGRITRIDTTRAERSPATASASSLVTNRPESLRSPARVMFFKIVCSRMSP